jgi:hypothetical protein
MLSNYASCKALSDILTPSPPLSCTVSINTDLSGQDKITIENAFI